MSRLSVSSTQRSRGFSSMSAGTPFRTVQHAVVGGGGGGGGGITSSTASYSYSSRGGGCPSLFGGFGGTYGSSPGGFQCAGGSYGQAAGVVGGGSGSGGFGFSSYSTTNSGGSFGGSGIPQITNVCINKSLLAPLNLAVDPTFGAIKTQEKEEIKVLNNKFVNIINKVQCLEQTNTALRTKWELMQQQRAGGAGTGDKCDRSPLFQIYINNMKRQHENLLNDKNRLENDLQSMQTTVEDFKSKYEDEINGRTTLENEFVNLKKDVDAAFMDKVKLEALAQTLHDEIDFRRNSYAEELQYVQSTVEDINAIVQMNNNRDLDFKELIENCKCFYDEQARKSREDTEAFYKTKYEELTASAGRQGDDVRSTKEEIAELNRRLKQLKNEIENVKRQCSNLETAIAGAEERGEMALQDARAKLAELEAALRKAKENLANQIREYQLLMNIKAGLDMEIATYNELLRGEECRMDGTITPQSSVYIQKSSTSSGGGSSAGGYGGGLGAGLGGAGFALGGGVGGGGLGFSGASGSGFGFSASSGGGFGGLSGIGGGGGGSSIIQSKTIKTVQSVRR